MNVLTALLSVSLIANLNQNSEIAAYSQKIRPTENEVTDLEDW